MKKTYLRRTVITLGLLAGTLVAEGQSAGGGAAGGGGAAAGSAGGAASSGSTVGGTATGASRAGGLNTIGGASINRPTGAGTVGAANSLQPVTSNPGGTFTSGGINSGQAGANTPAGTLPGGGFSSTTQGSVPVNTLPANIRTTIQGLSASGTVGSITPVVGQPGTYRATVTQNGAPMEMVIGPNGQVVSRTAVTGSPNSIQAADMVANAQAGVPLTSLPANLQNSIQSQLGGATVQAISRDDVANGSVLRVTATRNGVPTEFRFAANGTLLGSAPLSGVATSGVVPGAVISTPTPVVMSDLPNSIQGAIRQQLGDASASGIMQHRSATGVNYLVSYDQNGRPMTLVVGPDGRILSNGPAAAATTGALARGGSETNRATTRASVRLDDLPDDVESVLKEKAPYAEVRTITREERVGGDVYVVAVRDGDRAGELTIDADGKIISDTRRDLSALTPRAPIVNDDKPLGMPYDELPVAIQNAVKAYAAASEIRSITLGLDRDGKTIYDVIYYRDGNRDRLIVAKDGTLRRREQNVSSALEVDTTKPPVLAIGDLPQEVRDTIRRQTDNVLVRDINTKQVGDQTVYQVNYSTNGTDVQLLVSQDGDVVLPGANAGSDDESEAIIADVDREEPSPAVVVEPTRSTAGASTTSATVSTSSSAGRAAVTESGISGINNSSTSTATAATSVKLSDAPEPVRKTVQKLAGSGAVQTVTPKVADSGFTYEVTYVENGQPRTVVINRDGTVQRGSTTSKP